MAQTKEEIACKRLRKVYGISLAEYEDILAKQGGGCAVCGRPPGDRRLHLDHDHAFRYIKLTTVKAGKTWQSKTSQVPFILTEGKTKPEAIRKARSILKRLSVRGICCYKHNAGLQKFQDNPTYLHSAGLYLEAFHNRLNTIYGKQT